MMKEQEPGGPDKCVCPDCDYETDKKRGTPCRSMTCPECGAKLIAKVEEGAAMPMIDVGQIAKSAIETGPAVVKSTGEITPERAERLLYALEADLGEVWPGGNGRDVIEADTREDVEKAQRARSKRYGIAVIDPPQGNRTKPSEYADVSDADFGDPVNYKWPADADHARAALGYFNRESQREKGGYSEADWAKVGRRLARLISRHLTADYEYRDGRLVQEEEQEEAAYREVAGGLEDYVSRIRGAFRTAFRPQDGATEVPVDYWWVKEVFSEHPQLGDLTVVEKDGVLWGIGYEPGDDGEVTFAAPEDWKRIKQTYTWVAEEAEPAAAEELGEFEFSESVSGRAIGLAEADLPDAGNRAPLLLDVALIQPGPGNAKDRHYYPADVLKRDAAVFEGAKMYATDHRPEEKSVRTEVAIIKVCPTGFTDDGAPIARVAIHDPDFAEATRNRERAGTLNTLEVSILATGTAKKGEIDGEKYNIVEAITHAQSVDFVTRAGAGGRALALAESDTGGEGMEEEREAEVEEVGEAEAAAEPVTLAESDVETALAETNLPEFAKTSLAAGEYETAEQLQEAIATVVAEVKELTGSGRPFAVGEGAGSEPLSLEEQEKRADERFDRIMREIGME